MTKKSITFLSPSKIDTPTGGMKMVLEHANRLAFDGYDVIIENLFNVSDVCMSSRVRELYEIVVKRIFVEDVIFRRFSMGIRA